MEKAFFLFLFFVNNVIQLNSLIAVTISKLIVYLHQVKNLFFNSRGKSIRVFFNPLRGITLCPFLYAFTLKFLFSINTKLTKF
jgi:hypothetical protein